MNDAYENLPFEFSIKESDDLTATLVCSMLIDRQYELFVNKCGTDEYQMVTGNMPFSMDMGTKYSVTHKTVYNGTIYYYGGFISVIINDGAAVVQKEGFFSTTLPEYVDISDNVMRPFATMSDELPGAATITNPSASGTTYILGITYSYSFTAGGSSKYHTAVKIISGTPDPSSSSEPGIMLLDDLNASSPKAFSIPNSDTYAGQWLKLYVRGGNNYGEWLRHEVA